MLSRHLRGSAAAPQVRAAPGRRLSGRLVSALPVLIAALLGCQEDAQSPTGPEPAPALASVTQALAFAQVSGGWDRSCGVTTDHRAYCWGNNSQGQLGDNTTINRVKPVAVAGGLSFLQVSAGFAASCGVTTDHRAYCWGANERGELGDGTTTQRLKPVAVAGGHLFRQVESNFQHSCGVTYPDNKAYCWGENTDGRLGDGTLTNRSKPAAVAGGLLFRQITAGYRHTCGVATDNRAYCWGLNSSGQLGDSTETYRRLKPRRVAAGTHRFLQVDAGAVSTCAVTTDNRALCWGDGRMGQIGNGRAYLSFWPRRVAGGLQFAKVTAADTHSCGTTTGNKAWCWGANYNGQLGDGTTTSSLTPVAVAGGFSFTQVSAGISHTCGRTPGSVAYCWGRNFTGQLGNGTKTVSLTPAPVAGP